MFYRVQCEFFLPPAARPGGPPRQPGGTVWRRKRVSPVVNMRLRRSRLRRGDHLPVKRSLHNSDKKIEN